MFDQRFALARHQQQSLVAVLVATVVAGAITLATVGPLRTVADDEDPLPVQLVETTQRVDAGPARTGARELQVEARSFDAADYRGGIDAPTDEDRLTSEPVPTTPSATSPPAPEETQPPATDPPPTDPPPTDPPSTTEPPPTEPSVTDPPPTEPTVTTVPTTEPPEPEPTLTLPPITFPRPTFTILPPDDDDD